jgi:hypothetical protein
MLYIGTTILACSVLLNTNIDICSKINSSLPIDIRDRCRESNYIDINSTVNPLITLSYPQPTSISTPVKPSIPVNPSTTETSQSSYVPTIIASSGLGVAFIAGLVAFFVNRKKNTNEDDIENNSENLDILMPPVARVYSQHI